MKKVGFEKAIDKFKSVIGCERDLMLVELLSQTGCRVSELLQLGGEDCRRGVIRFYNRDRPKLVRVSKGLYNKIRKIKGYVFQCKGKPVTKRRVEQIFAKYSEISGVKITPNKLRGYYLNRLLSSEAQIDKISQKTGLRKIKKPVCSIDVKFPGKKRDLLIFAVFFETGCKTSELVRLKAKDVGERSLNFSGRKVKASPELCRWLKTYNKDKGPDAPVFLQANNHALSKRRVQQIIRSCSKGKKLTPSAIRKHFIYRQIKAGRNKEYVKSIAGVKRVDAYTHGVKEVFYEG